MRTYSHLFLATCCEAPGCRVEKCDIYLTNERRNAVRACCARHAEGAENHLRQLEPAATSERRAA